MDATGGNGKRGRGGGGGERELYLSNESSLILWTIRTNEFPRWRMIERRAHVVPSFAREMKRVFPAPPLPRTLCVYTWMRFRAHHFRALLYSAMNSWKMCIYNCVCIAIAIWEKVSFTLPACSLRSNKSVPTRVRYQSLRTSAFPIIILHSFRPF